MRTGFVWLDFLIPTDVVTSRLLRDRPPGPGSCVRCGWDSTFCYRAFDDTRVCNACLVVAIAAAPTGGPSETHPSVHPIEVAKSGLPAPGVFIRAFAD